MLAETLVSLPFIPRETAIRKILVALNLNYLIAKQLAKEEHSYADSTMRGFIFVMLGQMFGSGKSRLIEEFLNYVRINYNGSHFPVMDVLQHARYVAVNFREVNAKPDHTFAKYLSDLIIHRLQVDTDSLNTWIETNYKRLPHRRPVSDCLLHLMLFLQDRKIPIFLHLDELQRALTLDFSNFRQDNIVLNATAIWTSLREIMTVETVSVVSVGKSSIFYSLGKQRFLNYSSPSRFQTIHLPPFSFQEIRQLVNCIVTFADESLKDEITKRIEEKTAGIPLMVKTLLNALNSYSDKNFDPDKFFEEKADAYLDELIEIVLPVSVTTLNQDQQKIFIKLIQMGMLHIPISIDTKMDMDFRYNNNNRSTQIHKVSIVELSAMFGFYTHPIDDNALKVVIPQYILQKIQRDLRSIPNYPFLPQHFQPETDALLQRMKRKDYRQDLSQLPSVFESPSKKRRLDDPSVHNQSQHNETKLYTINVTLHDKQYAIYLQTDQKTDTVKQLLQAIRVQLVDDEVLKESDTISAIELQSGSVVTKTVLKNMHLIRTSFVIQIE